MSKWVWILGIPATLVAVGTFVTVTWPILGYETPRGHAADIAEVRQGVATATAFAADLEDRVAGQIKESSDKIEQRLQDMQDEARCDKINSELPELRRRLRQDPDDVELADEILRLEQRRGVNGLNCARFDV